MSFKITREQELRQEIEVLRTQLIQAEGKRQRYSAEEQSEIRNLYRRFCQIADPCKEEFVNAWFTREYRVYYSRCPTGGHFVLIDPTAPDFERKPRPTVLNLEQCPVCGAAVCLVGFREGFVNWQDLDRGWCLVAPDS